MNFDSYLEPPIASKGIAYVETNELQTELELESFGKTASALSGRKVAINAESYADDNDVPLQDITITIRGLPMGEANMELIEVFHDLTGAITAAEAKKEAAFQKKAAAARAEMDARQTA